MQALDLNIEHCIGVYSYSQCCLDIVRQALFVALLDCGPFLTESGILNEFKQACQFVKVLEPFLLWDFECLRDEIGK